MVVRRLSLKSPTSTTWFNSRKASLTSMLKTTNKPAPSKNTSSRSASSRNNNSMSAFERNDGDGEINRFGGDGVKHAKKSRKSKGQKTFKSQKSAKSGKNSSKSGNSPNFGTTESGRSFLTPETRLAFNRLWLAYTKAWLFDILIRNAIFRSKLMHKAMLLVVC